MKKKNISTFYIKCLLLSLPFIALIVLYILKDPFMVVRKYHDYDHPEVCESEGTVGWFKYKMLRNKMHYDSFIMGTSCTKAFNTQEWNKYIHAHPYRLFSNAEGLADLYIKLKALDKQPGQKIENLLIVCEKDFFVKTGVQRGMIHAMPPEVSGESEITFQVTFLQTFCSPLFLWKYFQYNITHHYNNGMKGVINIDGCTHTLYTNDAILPNELKIKTNGERFWQTSMGEKERNHKYIAHENAQTIYNAQLAYLYNIKDICRQHGTNVKFAIGPSSAMASMNHADIAILRKIFGKNNVVDFSDKTHKKYSDYHNFYDNDHYRITVGRDMMKELYKSDNINK